MSVIASLYSGISGVIANGSALSVSGDNIANMNTTAFKTGSALFESSLTQRIGDVEVGLGSRLATASASFSQGAFASSSRPTDLAIQGDGFFAVKSASDTSRFYTRAGSFTRDSDGNLVTTVGGYQLLGYRITNGNQGTIEEPISFANISTSPISSHEIAISMNLDPNMEIPASSFDGSTLATAEASSNFSVPGVMYDSRGTARQVVTFFRRTADNDWEYYTLTDLTNLDATQVSGTGTAVVLAGSVQFDTDGSLLTSTIDNNGNGLTEWNASGAGAVSVAISAGELLNAASGIPWAGADEIPLFDPGDYFHDGTSFPSRSASSEEFVIDFGQFSESDAVVTQYDAGGTSTVSNVETDGVAVGDLQSIEITKEGLVKGIFSTGASQDLYRIPLAKFANQEGLLRAGSNLYQASATSGDPQLGQAGAGDLGEILSFSLEQSNVDIATEFVKIIQYQRAFQASSRTISAASELLESLVNLGR